jgi:hypothetical protein
VLTWKKTYEEEEPMSSVALRVVLHGLIALVPTTDDGVHHMTALLLNGLEPHGIEEKCNIVHQPKLKFLVAETNECDEGCIFSGNQCTCGLSALKGKEISIEIQPNPTLATQRPNNERPIDSIPTSPEEAGDPTYIANLAQPPFNLAFNQAYLESNPPEHLLLRMEVPTTITACLLATREDRGRADVYPMSFRKLHDPSSQNEASQALAQMAIAYIPDISANGQENPTVILRIRNFNEPLTGGRTFVLLAGANGYKIELSNQPERPLDRDDPCNDTVARHFAMFYELAQDPPALRARLLPHFSFTQSRDREELTPEICRNPVFGLMDRPSCPMAIFNP